MSRPRLPRRRPHYRHNRDALAIAHDALNEIDRIGDLATRLQGGPEGRRKDRAMLRLGWALDVLYGPLPDTIVLEDEGDDE